MRGRAIWNQPSSTERARQARAIFEAALYLDDHSVDALLGIAEAHLYDVYRYAYSSKDPGEQIRAAKAAVLKALALTPNSAYVQNRAQH
jgi:hypothetical protein